MPSMPMQPQMMGMPMNMPMQMQPMAMQYPPMNMQGMLPPLPPPDTPWQMNAQHMAKMPAPIPQGAAQMAPAVYAASMPPTLTAPTINVPKAPAASLADPEVRGLMSMMRGRQAELPEDMQKKVQSVLSKYGKQSAKDLHAAVTMLDKAREDFDAAVLARSQHHATWKKFLADAVQLWKSYADQFVEQEKKLQEQVAITKEQFVTAKTELENAKLDAGEVLNTSENEAVEDSEHNAGTTTATKLTETMQGLAASLQTLHKEAEILVEEDHHVAKRPRTAEHGRQDQAMDEESLGASSHFGKAG